MSSNLFRSFSPDPFRYAAGGSGPIGGTTLPLAGATSGPISSDRLENILGVFPCVRLRGLPPKTSVDDVLLFFHGLMILDVVVDDAVDKESGEAFVVFANPLDFQVALQRERIPMGRIHIEVFQGKRMEYYAAIASQFYRSKGNNGQQTDDVGEGSAATEKPQEQPTTNAWAGPTPAQALQRVKTKPVSGRGHRGGTGGTHRGGRGSGGGIQVGEHTGYLRMRGLPFNTTKSEIMGFFKSHVRPIEDSITLTYRSDGRATGEGYVAFHTPDDAKQAMSLHRNMIGSRYIELFISNKEEHSRSIARSGGR